jgi:hypothetical protein
VNRVSSARTTTSLIQRDRKGCGNSIAFFLNSLFSPGDELNTFARCMVRSVRARRVRGSRDLAFGAWGSGSAGGTQEVRIRASREQGSRPASVSPVAMARVPTHACMHAPSAMPTQSCGLLAGSGRLHCAAHRTEQGAGCGLLAGSK